MIIIRCPLRITPDGSCLKDVTYIYSGIDRGWKGDIPVFQFDLSKIHKRGRSVRHTSTEAFQATWIQFFK